MAKHIYTAAIVLLTYVLIASAQLNFNPIEWHWVSRSILTAVALLWLVSLVVKDKKQQNTVKDEE